MNDIHLIDFQKTYTRELLSGIIIEKILHRNMMPISDILHNLIND